MMAGRPIFALKLVLAAAMVWLQAYSLAHAVEHGEEAHQHDGVECELTVFATEDMGILPTGEVGDFTSLVQSPVVKIFGALQARTWPPERGPPPRGPPV